MNTSNQAVEAAVQQLTELFLKCTNLSHECGEHDGGPEDYGVLLKKSQHAKEVFFNALRATLATSGGLARVAPGEIRGVIVRLREDAEAISDFGDSDDIALNMKDAATLLENFAATRAPVAVGVEQDYEKINRQVAQMIADNDRIGALKWAVNLIGDFTHVKVEVSNPDLWTAEEIEEVIVCLDDDATAMLDENDEDERAHNMQRAATMIQVFNQRLSSHPTPAQKGVPVAEPVGEVLKDAAAMLRKYHRLCVGAGKGDSFWLARILEVENACRAAATPASVPAVGEALRSALQDLIRGYVNLLETGRDRIRMAGGHCDPLEVMERSDPRLRAARAVLAAQPILAQDAKDARSNSAHLAGGAGGNVHAPGPTDAERLDWADQNIFYREMDEWDRQRCPGYSMWVMFSPTGAQGSARNIIDAAILSTEQSQAGGGGSQP